MPGTTPVTSSALDTTVQSAPTLSKVTVEVVSSVSGGVPAFARPAASAMQKQLACAAARSSSGLVFPCGASVRAPHETGSELNFPLVTAPTSPLPVARSPFHFARACRVAAMDHLLCEHTKS